jgi:uncharacterized protein (DUF486 family)
MERLRDDPAKSDRNVRLRVGAAVLAVAVLLAGANRYMELGWFGPYGRLVSASANLLTIIYLTFAVRAWRN